MKPSLAESYRECEAIARREAANFYPAFRILPRDQRLGMCAVYAFFRIADDCGDDDGTLDEKRRRLTSWREGLAGALAGRYAHPTHEALADAVARFSVPVECLEATLDGVAMDLDGAVYPTFAELREYCRRVASVVGVACIRVWGLRDPAADPLAEQAGIAFQLTNILRDLREDAQRGRVYLPAEDLARFGVDPTRFTVGLSDDAYKSLMRFEIARARAHYDASAPLARMLPRPGRAVFGMMTRTYRRLLDEIEQRDYDVFSARVRVARWRKLAYALRALATRAGLG